MRRLAVIAEPFAVITGDGDDRARGAARRIQPLQDAADLRVRERDFPVVRVSLGLLQELLWRIVRRVRVVEMDPREERTGIVALEPRKGGIDHDIAAALGFEPHGA